MLIILQDGSMKAKCIDMNAETFVYAAINMSVDIIIFLFPIFQVSLPAACS